MDVCEPHQELPPPKQRLSLRVSFQRQASEVRDANGG